MHCPYCGRIIKDDDTIDCPYCSKPLKQSTKTTRLPTVAGILTIIAACIALIFGSLFLIVAIDYATYLPELTYLLSQSLLYILTLVFGLTGGICCIKRKHFKLAKLGSTFPIATATISFPLALLMDWQQALEAVVTAGVPLLILGVLATFFLYDSRREFS